VASSSGPSHPNLSAQNGGSYSINSSY
jgi:hypothetical protein